MEEIQSLIEIIKAQLDNYQENTDLQRRDETINRLSMIADLMKAFSLSHHKVEILRKSIEALGKVASSRDRPSIEEYLDTLLDWIISICDTEEKSVGLLQLIENQSTGRWLVVKAEQGGSNKKIKPLRIDVENIEGITATVAISGKPMLIEDIRQDEYKDIFVPMMEENTIAELAVPIFVNENVIGVINLENELAGAFSNEDLLWVSVLAVLMGVSIQILRHYTQIRTIRDLNMSITRHQDKDATVADFYDKVGELTGAENMMILTYDRELKLLILDEYTDWITGTPIEEVLTVNIGEGVSGRAAEQSRVIYIPDIKSIEQGGKKDNGKPLYIPYLKETRANLAIYMKVGNQLVGVLNIESPRPHAFDDVSHEVLEIIAAAGAAAIHLMETFKLQQEHTKRSLKALALLNIEGASKSLGTFHDMISKITTVPPDINLLLEHFPEIRKHERGMSILERIIIDIKEASQMARELYTGAKAEAGEGSSLEQALEQIIPKIQLNSIKIHKNYEEEIGNLVVGGFLSSVLTQLIENAVKALGNQGNIWVGAEAIDRNWINFIIKDDGPGIAQEHHQAIFEEFRKFDDKPGSGLGLSLVQMYVEIVGGEIGIESQEGEGASFYFTLPRIRVFQNGR